MAAPSNMQISTLKGRFRLNRKLSDSPDGIFAIQSIPYLVRKITSAATIELNLTAKKPAGPGGVEFEMSSTITAIGPVGLGLFKTVGLNPVTTYTRILDGSEYTINEPVIGESGGRWWIAKSDEVQSDSALDAFGKSGTWASGAEVLRMSLWSLKPESAKPWKGEHVWGFEVIGNEGTRYTARWTMWRGEGEDMELSHARLVYDYVG